MKSITNLLESKITLDYLRARKSRNFLGKKIFPAKSTESLRFDMVVGAYNIPVMAKVTPMGSMAPILDRNGTDIMTGKIPSVKIKMSLDEEEYIQLVKFQSKGYDIPESVVKKIYDDIGATFDSVQNRIESMRWQALSTGKLDFAEDGYSYSVDYRMDPENLPNVSTLWSDPNADIMGDLRTWINLIKDKGGDNPIYSVTSNKILQYILSNIPIRKAMLGVNSDKLVVQSELNRFFETLDLPKVTSYDLRVKKYDKSTTRFLPEDKFIILPYDGIAGETLQGPVAEEILKNETVSKVKTEDRITVVQWEEREPVALWTKAATTQIPTLPYANSMVSATVI